MDTSAVIHERQIDLLRRLSPTERLRIAFDLSEFATKLALSDIDRKNPDCTQQQRMYLLALRRYGKEVVERLMEDPFGD